MKKRTHCSDWCGLAGCCPVGAHAWVAGSVPGLGAYERQLINVFPSHQSFFPFLSCSLPFSLIKSINIFKKRTHKWVQLNTVTVLIFEYFLPVLILYAFITLLTVAIIKVSVCVYTYFSTPLFWKPPNLEERWKNSRMNSFIPFT